MRGRAGNGEGDIGAHVRGRAGNGEGDIGARVRGRAGNGEGDIGARTCEREGEHMHAHVRGKVLKNIRALLFTAGYYI